MTSGTDQNTQGVSKELVEDINYQIREASALSSEAKAQWQSYQQGLQLEEKESSNIWGLIFLAIAVSALSFSAIFTRLSENYMGVNAIVLNRCLFSTLAVFGWQAIAHSVRPSENVKPEKNCFTLSDLGLFMGLGAGFILCSILWAWSLSQTTVANSNLLHNATPLFTVLGAWLFLRERFNSQYLFGIAIAIGGSLLIGLQDLHLSLNSLIGDLAALLSAAFYALQYLLTEQLGKKFDTATILIGMTGIGTILLIPVVLLTGESIFPSSAMGWVWIGCIVLISQLLGQGLLARSLKQFSSTFIAMIMLLEPFFTAIFAYLIFSEQLSLMNWIGFFWVLGGIYVVKLAGQTAKV